MKFSIIVVCLNPGEKLNQTLDSILDQTFADYEIIVKDGKSRDGSIERMRQDRRIRFFSEEDRGIYDAMNQAVSHVQGDFVLFLNCGDKFYHNKVLEQTAAVIEREEHPENLVLYGDTYSEKSGVMISSPPKITGLVCYRNIPCHQSCFYAARLCREKPYEESYRIRADYDHFLWCRYKAGAKMVYLNMPVSSYEGGGYSESRENQKRDKEEHRQITKKYMNGAELFSCRLFMLCTLAPLRRLLAENQWSSGIYHWFKEQLYRRKLWILAGFLLFAVELLLLVWPVGWLGEEKENFLTGEGMWLPEVTQEENSFCQTFVPQYSHVKSIGIYIGTVEQELSGGSALFVLSDQQDNILLQREIPYTQETLNVYTDVSVNLELNPSQTYYLTIALGPSEQEVYPSLGVCGTEYEMRENKSLIQGEEMPQTQLLTRYRYEDAISRSTVLKALFLCGLTGLAVAFSLPKNRVLRLLAGGLLLLAGPYILGRRLELLTINPMFQLSNAMLWNMAIMYGLELVLLLAFQSARVSVCVSNLALTLLYSANYFVYAYRGEPLRLNDFSAIGTAAKVVERYDLSPNSHMAMAWGIGLLLFVCGLKVGWPKRKKLSVGRVISHGVTLCLSVALTVAGGYVLLYTDFLENQGFTKIRGFDQNMNYHFNGYLVASCMDIQASRIVMPQGYSIETVEEILQNAVDMQEGNEEYAQELPHVILIMNESFSDLRVLGNLQLSQENLPFFNSLKENAVRGYVNASVLGGGTANSEFEALTGCTMGFFPTGYYAYQQCMVKPINSLVSNMEAAGYTSYSIHPEAASNWNRDRVYQYFGFDNSYWIEDFQGAEKIHYGVSDLETYRFVENLFENRQEGEKLFIFNLTVQNHGGYGSDIDVTVDAQNASTSEADVYLSLIKESDAAFEQLIDYFEKQQEKVIICMFGDHQPKLADESFYETVYRQTEGLSERDKKLNLYKTPFIIWANYDIPEAEGLDIGMSYLGALLLKTAQIPCSPFYTFLQQEMERYPIVTVNGFFDKEGVYYDWPQEQTQLLEYRMLQYNYLFDSHTVEWGF